MATTKLSVKSTVYGKGKLMHYRSSVLKVSRVLKLIRKRSVNDSIAILSTINYKASNPVLKLIQSIVANIKYKNQDIDINNLVISSIYATEGTTLKRMRPRAQGRAYRIRKRSSNIFIEIVGNIEDGT